MAYRIQLVLYDSMPSRFITDEMIVLECGYLTHKATGAVGCG